MKKLFVLATLVLAFVLTACSPSAPKAAPTAAPAPAPTTIIQAVAPRPVKTATWMENPDQIGAALDKRLQDLTKAQQFSGSFLVSKNGKVLLSKGYGLADREKKTPITAQTKFRIGTTTKQFTAMAIILLQEQGKLNVQDKICTYLTDCPEAWKTITIHQLLTQTSGIPDNSDAFITQDITSSAPRENMIAEAKKLPLDFQPGERYSNNSLGYILLGKIIEAASGGSYEAFLHASGRCRFMLFAALRWPVIQTPRPDQPVAGALIARSGWRFSPIQQPGRLFRLHRLRRPVCHGHNTSNRPPGGGTEPLPAQWSPDRRSA